ncbi:MAG: DUF4924 family protein [Bacteroidaceae bacterium]
MYISEQLKKKNQAEYLLYLWQIEDQIRACDLDISLIEQRVLAGYQLSEEQLIPLRQWYEERIEMMRVEGVVTKGHLALHNNVLINLVDLHMELISSSKFPFYSGAYYKALPFIVELRAKSQAQIRKISEVETCFEFLYGIMLLRLQKKELSKETTDALQPISNLISLLANYRDKEIKGELKLED